MTEPQRNHFVFAPSAIAPACEVCGGEMTRVITKVHLSGATRLGGPGFEVDESHFACLTCQGRVS